MTIAIVSCLGILAALGFTVTGAHLAARVHAAEHRLTVFFMPATGERADPRETGPLNVLPVAPTPPRGTAVLQDRMVSDVRAEYDMTPHGKHHAGERKPVTEQVIEVAEAPGRPPWPRVTGSFPKLDGAAEAIERTAYIRRQMADATVTRDPQVMQQVIESLKRDEAAVYGEKCQLDVERAQQTPAGYDPANDNCAGTPGCGDERVPFRYYGTEMFACPRCYENVFGAAPDPAAVFTIAAGQAQGLIA